MPNRCPHGWSCEARVARLLWEPTAQAPIFAIPEAEQGIRPLTPSAIFSLYTGLEYGNVHTNVHTF